MTPGPKLAIAIDLNQLHTLMREFMAEMVEDDDNNMYAYPFELFLRWAMKRQREEATNEPTQRTTNLRAVTRPD